MYMRFQRWTWLMLLALVSSISLAPRAGAHHGWGWATEEEFELTGTITHVRLGNPHGEVTLEVNGKQWVVEVGQPWRNARVGLRDELLRVGQVMTAHGHRSSKEGERVMKAERVVIEGQHYNLYPDRVS